MDTFRQAILVKMYYFALAVGQVIGYCCGSPQGWKLQIFDNKQIAIGKWQSAKQDLRPSADQGLGFCPFTRKSGA
jgi:hypothetical protein